jgi:hypothetical protein
MCPIPNGFRDRAISLYSSFDLAHNIVFPSRMWIGVKCQLAVVTVDSDIVGVLGKMRHRFINAECAETLICCMLSSDELQSALMLTVEFSKMYYTGSQIYAVQQDAANNIMKLYQLCHLNNKYRY